MTVQELFQQFSELSDSMREKGDHFERFIKKYLTTYSVYANTYESVWLWMDFPYRDGKSDSGIDLVARDKLTGEFTAIQCKFFSPVSTIDKKAIDSFISAMGKGFRTDVGHCHFSNGLIVTSTDKWGKTAEDTIADQKIPINRIGLSEFLDNERIDWSVYSLRSPDKLKRSRQTKELREHQRQAVLGVTDGFKSSDRGKLIMACGTGKTFTSLRIAEKMAGKGGVVLFLMPSISLLSQTIKEWLTETKLSIACIPVCSDSKVGKRGGDDLDISVSELIYPASTSVKAFVYRYDLMKGKANMCVVFSTYQSIDVISKAQLKAGFEFDLIICDEAHRTTGARLAGDDESAFTRVHNNNFIKSKKRLYMTATPRVYGEDAKSKAGSDYVLCSMDDRSLYGDEFYHLGFGNAVAKDLLSDYKVLILTVNESFMPTAEQKILAEDGSEIDINEDFPKIYGCWNALSKRKLKDVDNSIYMTDPKPMVSAVAFNSTIKSSKLVCDYIRIVQKKEHSKSLIKMSIDHVDGTMNSMLRNNKLSWLKSKPRKGECKILTNARCLSEGIDVPALDAVIFLSPRNSIVDVVQSVGRVMRKSEGKKYGYIILPVIIPSYLPADEALSDNKRYKVIWDVLQALRAHDDRFKHIINTLELNMKMNEKISIIGIGMGDGGGDSDSDSIDISKGSGNLHFDISAASQNWQNAIIAKAVEKCGDKRYWETWANDVAGIAQHQIKIITDQLSKGNGQFAKEFANFLDSLHTNLNDTISKSDAIEMLSQHLITKPIFEALFENYSFVKNNPVSLAMQSMLDLLNDESLKAETKKLDSFYDSVRDRVKGVDNAEGKQKIIIELYDKFFKTSFPKMVDKLGIVYTPVEIVDFIIKSVDTVLRDKFGKSIGDKGVHIIDPFTGTGTFIVRLLQSGLISDGQLLYKYTNEIHANEIVLLAYYIAAINIESAFHDLQSSGSYKPFEGIVLTDTFALAEEGRNKAGAPAMEENNKRLQKQRTSDIKVIIGNPPYSIGQTSENDNNKNLSYPILDKAVENTYVKNSNANLRKGLYDSYIKAFRWATDRLKEEGIVCFVTNGSYIDNASMDGFRKSLASEFSEVYCFNLRGNQRTSGELSRKEGGKIFGGGSRTPIAVTLLIKTKGHKGAAKIYYNDIGDYLDREEKLDIISKSEINTMKWQLIKPNAKSDWINKRNNKFQPYITLGDNKDKDNFQVVFTKYSSGVLTSRDTWCYNYSKANLIDNMSNMISFYNSERARLSTLDPEILENENIENLIDTDPKKISWSTNLKKDISMKKTIIFDKNKIRVSLYRPFTKQYLYFDRQLNERVYQQPALFPTESHKNLLIMVNGTGGLKEFSTLITDTLPDYQLLQNGQCFPLYYYEKHEGVVAAAKHVDKFGYIRHDAVSDYIHSECTSRYGAGVTKEDIFYYVYGILHSPEYRKEFSNDLKKMLPRLPFVKSAADFFAFSKAARTLAKIHLNYETIKPYPLTEEITNTKNCKVEIMKFASKSDKSKLIYSNNITLSGIPPETHEYIVNGKSAIEWLVDRYRVKTDPDSLIINNANDWSNDKRYIIDLFKRVVTLSIETMEIVHSLPKLDVK